MTAFGIETARWDRNGAQCIDAKEAHPILCVGDPGESSRQQGKTGGAIADPSEQRHAAPRLA